MADCVEAEVAAAETSTMERQETPQDEKQDASPSDACPKEEAVPATAEELRSAVSEKLKSLLEGVNDLEVLKELLQLSDAASLEKLVMRGRVPKWKRTDSGGGGEVKQASAVFSMKKAANLGTTGLSSIAVGGAGAGGGLGLNRPGFGPSVKHFAGGARGSGTAKTIVVEDEISAAWLKVKDDQDPLGWVVLHYSGDNKTLTLGASGDGLKSFKDALPGENVAWGGFRCYGVDKRGGVECKRPKFVFVQSKPEGASAIKKARSAAHKGDVKEALPGAHLDVVAESMDDLDEQKLMTSLQSAAGAHKPNGYMFEEGCFLEADYYGLGIGKDCKGESAKN